MGSDPGLSDLERLLKKLPSKYAVTVAVAERARQLESGSRGWATAAHAPPLRTAIEEIIDERVQVEIREEADEEEEAAAEGDGAEAEDGQEAEDEAKSGEDTEESGG
jgi:DNA-directed RNA polymerase subunit K/omega